MQAARFLKLAPPRIAEEITKRLSLEDSFFSEAKIAGPGFIKFPSFSGSWYERVLESIEEEAESYGCCKDGQANV
jgi:arginyl-tRNA synthetase